MIVITLGLASAAYVWGLLRARQMRRAFPRPAPFAFAAAVVVLAIALGPNADALADASLAWHMVQHLLLAMVAAPLVLFGSPVRLALTALPARAAAALGRAFRSPLARALGSPAFAWLQFAFVLYGAHFSPLYEAALEHPLVHVFEHALFFGSAVLFWLPILAVAPAPHAPSHPVRLFLVFGALPMTAFLGFALYVQHRILYEHYAHAANAAGDQATAGVVMWLAGGVPLFVTLLALVADWGARERRFGELADAKP